MVSVICMLNSLNILTASFLQNMLIIVYYVEVSAVIQLQWPHFVAACGISGVSRAIAGACLMVYWYFRARLSTCTARSASISIVRIASCHERVSMTTAASAGQGGM
jgi:hypothetical protein